METTLAFCKNFFGNIEPKIKERLQAVIDNPNQETWDDTHCIIISQKKGFRTLWQAVLDVDPSFQRRASMDSETYETRWERIPTSDVIKEAIRREVFDFNLN